MQVFYDLALGLFLQNPNSNNEITQITAKRATSNIISLQFLNNGTPTTLPPSSQFIFCGKAAVTSPGSAYYDGAFAVYVDNTGWTGPDENGFYNCTPGYNTTVLNALFGYTYPNQDSLPHPDSVALVGEISWLKPGDTYYTKTPYWTLLVYNDVSKGIEGVPTSGGPVYPAPSAIELAVNKGAPNGYAPLGSDARVPLANLPIATGTSLGIVQVGSHLVVNAGTASVPLTTGSSLGVMQVGSGLTVVAGVVSAPAPAPSAPVITSPAYTATLATALTGVPLTIVQVGALTGNITLSNPTGATNRNRVEFVLLQDGTGGRTLTLGSKFRFPSSSTLSSPISGSNSTDFATASKKSRLLVEYDSADDKFDVVAFVAGY